MSDWIRDPTTKEININADRVNEIVRKLMDKVKTLTHERDQARKEMNSLKNYISKLTDLKLDFIAKCSPDVDDDLETDSSANVQHSRIIPFVETKGKSKQMLFSPTDHSACCSKELSMKLVEQNQILQKTIRDILNLSGHSIDDYLSFTSNKENIMAKDREIKDLKAKIKKMEEQSLNEPSSSTHGKDLCEKMNELKMPKTVVKTSSDSTSLCLKNDRNDNKICENCLKKFDPRDQSFFEHVRRCKDMYY